MTALARLAVMFTALVMSVRALAVVAEARVTVLPGWVVPVPAVLLATVALAAAVLGARVALALLPGRVRLPYIAVAITWREVRP